MIPELRQQFNRRFTPAKYESVLDLLEKGSGTRIEFRVAETPVFIPFSRLKEMANEGAAMAQSLIANSEYLTAARQAIPRGFDVANETKHPHFLTADFALVRDAHGELEPRLVEIQAFPSVFGYQALLCDVYRQVFDLPETMGSFLSGLDETAYWELLRRTILGNHAPENVVLTEVDPLNQKTLSDFNVTARHLGIAIVDIDNLQPIGNKLHYLSSAGHLIPIHRIYNRAIADELIARNVKLPFDLTHPWDVEWSGHPNWYFLISKFSVPWLSRAGSKVVPPAVFLSDFLEGKGRAELAAAGVALPMESGPSAVYDELLLKPLFSFAGKGIQFEPTQSDLEAIPVENRQEYLLQQRMRFEPTVATPRGPTQAEIRILYMWPDGWRLTPAICLVRLGRGKMMGVDHNKDQEWVGGSAAFFPKPSI